MRRRTERAAARTGPYPAHPRPSLRRKHDTPHRPSPRWPDSFRECGVRANTTLSGNCTLGAGVGGRDLLAGGRDLLGGGRGDSRLLGTAHFELVRTVDERAGAAGADGTPVVRAARGRGRWRATGRRPLASRPGEPSAGRAAGPGLGAFTVEAWPATVAAPGPEGLLGVLHHRVQRGTRMSVSRWVSRRRSPRSPTAWR